MKLESVEIFYYKIPCLGARVLLEGGEQGHHQGTIPGVWESPGFKGLWQSLSGPGREVECREGRRHLSSVLAASGHVDVCASLPVWAFCPREPAVSRLLTLHSGDLGQDCTVSGSTCQR